MSHHKKTGHTKHVRDGYWLVEISMIAWLVVWNMACIFPYIGNVIIPTDEVIYFFQVGVGQPPTSNTFNNGGQTMKPAKIFFSK
jgi:hypothetical protein